MGETCAELRLDAGPNTGSNGETAQAGSKNTTDAAAATDGKGAEVYETLVHCDKTAFSMMVPDVIKAVEFLEGESKGQPLDCIVVGIETHICVLQTSLDLLSRGHRVYVVQDAVSSCNVEERGVALARLRQEGARVTTSESLIYEIMGDAKDGGFKQIAGLIKETKAETKEALAKLCKI